MGVLRLVRQKIDQIDQTHWRAESLHAALEATVAELDVGFGKVGQPLRVALTGGAPAPGLDLVMALIGRETVLTRIDNALVFLGE